MPPLVYFFVQGGARLFEPERNADVAAAQQSGDPGASGSSYRERMAEALSVQPPGGAGSRGALSASALPVTLRPQAPESELPDFGAVTTDPAEGEPESVTRTSRLSLALEDDSWVEIEDAAGERLEFDLLRAGQSREYGGVPPFRLLLGRGSAVRVSLNGEPVAFDGQERAGVAEFELGAEPLPDGIADPSNQQ